MRLLVTASREHANIRLIYMTLESIYQEWRTHATDDETFIVVHGNARGGDWIARRWVQGKHRLDDRVDHESHPADWGRHGKPAGHIRNKKMVDLGADRCVGFPIGESKGTRGCMRLAEKAGIPTKGYE
jgi:hypothetical protein